MIDKIDQQLKYVISRSNFYQKKFRDYINLKTPINTIFDKLPLTTKTELLLDQENYPPFGNNLCVTKECIKRIHRTSGTTMHPLLIALTENDINRTIEVGSGCFRASGLRPKDIVVHCFDYNMWSGGYTDHQSLETCGAAVIPFGAGNSKRLIEVIRCIKPTAIHCTPSYLAKLEALLKDFFNLNPKDLRLKIGLFGGESGLQAKEFRDNIEKVWGFKAMNANYGISEVFSIFGAECRYQKGLHFMARGVLYPELIDYRNEKTLPIESGIIGELVLTQLCKEAQPLIRYRTNDIVKILSTAKCSCGRENFRFEFIGRSDDMITIKGVNIFVGNIERIINNHLADLTGAYQVFINKKDPVSNIILKMELRENHMLQVDVFRGIFISEFKEKLCIKPELELVDEGTLPRTERKSKKIFRTL